MAKPKYTNSKSFIPGNENFVLEALLKCGEPSNSMQVAEHCGYARQHCLNMLSALTKRRILRVDHIEHCQGGKRNYYWIDKNGCEDFLLECFKRKGSMNIDDLVAGLCFPALFMEELCEDLIKKDQLVWLSDVGAWTVSPEYAASHSFEIEENLQKLDDALARVIQSIWDSAVKRVVQLRGAY